MQKAMFPSMKKLLTILLFAWAMVSLAAAKEPGLLPPAFNGWVLDQHSLTSGSDPAVADPADSAALKEYGFADFETATYTRNGRKMQVKAARFNDASGAFGAFSYYVQPQMKVENLGDRGASNNSRILFYRGNLLVDASLEQVTAMSAADLRALAEALPRPRGNLSALPSLPGNLPKQSRLPNTERYILGPVALERLGVPIPAGLVDFSKAPEVEFARYRSSAGEAGLTLIEYPTPQMAKERLQAFQAASLPGGPFFMKRTGPVVAAINGNISESEAQSLLASVNYDADVTWNEPAKLNDLHNRITFLYSLALLIIIVVTIALVFGIAFGGFRILARKLFPNSGFSRREEVEIIRLNLK
jgi:hypothetical protein